MNTHPAGAPMSFSTYRNRGCRCDGCRAANTAEVRRSRQAAGGLLPADRAGSIARNMAAAWVRHNRPDLWGEFLDQANARIGYEPRWTRS